MAPNRLELRHRAANIRKNPTHAERILWSKLRARRLKGYKFRRQHILFPYIVDFYCFKMKLAVEVDGETHNNAAQAKTDEFRRAKLREVHGVEVLHFSNHQVRYDLTNVLHTIGKRIDAYRKPH